MTEEEIRQFRFTPPPGACEILLVRHGESMPARAGEPFPLVDGHGDPPLAPEGHAQAERVGQRLAGERIAAVYVTTLQRTAQTAAPLLDRLAIEARVEPDLREVHLGEWEGGAFRHHVAAGHPLAKRMLEEERWDVIPGAEPQEDFTARVSGAIRRLAERHPDQRIVAVTHGGVIGAILAKATGARPFAFTGADNGSLHHLVVLGDAWIVRAYNDTAHLGVFAAAPEPLT